MRATKGVTVPDGVWRSGDQWGQIPDDAEASPGLPALCVAVRPRRNADEGRTEKHRLYLDERAQEV